MDASSVHSRVIVAVNLAFLHSCCLIQHDIPSGQDRKKRAGHLAWLSYCQVAGYILLKTTHSPFLLQLDTLKMQERSRRTNSTGLARILFGRMQNEMKQCIIDVQGLPYQLQSKDDEARVYRLVCEHARVQFIYRCCLPKFQRDLKCENWKKILAAFETSVNACGKVIDNMKRNFFMI